MHDNDIMFETTVDSQESTLSLSVGITVSVKPFPLVEAYYPQGYKCVVSVIITVFITPFPLLETYVPERYKCVIGVITTVSKTISIGGGIFPIGI